MTFWEYTVMYSSGGKGMSGVVSLCNEHGAQGWELIHIEGNSLRGYELIFKRAKEQKEEFISGRKSVKR